MISAIQSTTAIDHVALIDLTGTAYYENGEVKDVSHRDYVRDGLAGKRFLSDPVQSIVDHETRVILGVPVYHQDTIIGILGVSYDVAALNRMMFEDLFDGNGFSIIIDEEGNIITLDGSSEHQRIGSSDNFFDFYDQWNFKGLSLIHI